MTTDIAKSAIAGSRLDYCNSLLYGVSAANLHKLQRVQNTFADKTTEYLLEYIQPLVRSRNLRSSGTDLLYISDSNLSPTNISRRAFSLAAPTIWNSLPIHSASTTATFINHRKTYFFTLAYPM